MIFFSRAQAYLQFPVIFLLTAAILIGLFSAGVGPLERDVSASTLPSILQQTSQAFSSGSQVSTLTLNGTVTSYAGGSTDTGTVVLTGSADGSSTVSLAMNSSGAHREVFAAVGFGRICQWFDNSGTSHDMESTSCAVPMAWFMPSVTLQPSVTYAATVDQGVGTLGGSQLRLLAVSPLPNGTTTSTASNVSGSVQVGLDPTTLLPSLIEYVIRPDTNPMSTIRVDVSFGNYVSQNGMMIPQSIQRRLNGSLDLDIVIQSCSTN